MAKGVSMTVARRASNAQPIKASAVGDDSGPFVCHACRVPVNHVNGYRLRGDDVDLVRDVQAFFRLAKRTEHGSGCVYVPSAQVERIVRDAQAVEDSVNPFEKDPDRDVWVFRLNIPTEEENREIEADPALARAPDLVRVERVWNGKRIESYCRSAVGLAKLWRALESSDGRDELKAKVRIVVAGETIPWEKFFFSENTIGEFADRVESKRVSYPIALLLHVNEVRTTSAGFQIRFTHLKDDAAHTDVRIAIEAFGKGISLSGFLSGNHYIVFGKFFYLKTKEWKPPGRVNAITFRDIRIKIYRKSQYELIEGFEPHLT